MLRIRSSLATALSLLPTLLFGCAYGADDTDGAKAIESLESPLSYRDGSDAIRYESDRIRQGAGGPFVQVDILVRNLSATKQVGVRGSFDGGAWQDHPAVFIETRADGMELWRAEVRNGSASFSRLEYALFYKDPGSGSAWWDNNRQKNFALGVWDRVHRVGDKLDMGKLTIELDVRNLAYEKQCAAAVTTDGWISQSWAHGEYAFATEVAEVERWRVVVDTATGTGAYGLDPKASSFEYVVMCRMGGTEYWDNANTANYHHYQAPPPARSWATSFDGATALAVGDDGTTFVLSAGSWVTAYSPDGVWLFSKQAPATVRRMTWLQHAGLLLLATDAASPDSQWIAWGADGGQRWALTSGLTELVVGNDAEYLVGAAGGARLGASAPEVVGPSGGCALGGLSTGAEAFPIVSRVGKMYCLDETSTIQGYDLDTGAAIGAFGGGWAWAASNDGTVVVVSTDRTSLTAYGPDGGQRWQKTGLSVPFDAQYGTGKACPNHAASDLAVVLNQEPGGGTPDNHYFAGVDVATGEERFRLPATDYTLNPCAGADGAFYYRPSYERYGRSMLRISASGEQSRINLGLNGQLFELLADGRAVRRDWAYYPSDRGRIAVTEGDGTELFSTSFFAQGPTTFVAALTGSHLVIAEPGTVTHLTFSSR